MKAVRVEVSGRVQGVGFRFATQTQAARWGLVGWVCNLPDGGVAVFAQGSVDAVDRLVQWLRIGPRMAQVKGLEIEPAEPDASLSSFRLRY